MATYPPPGHLIRHLGMELELRSADELRGTMPITADVRDRGGALRLGALATFIDVAAGTFSHEKVRPDWLATTDMKIHVRRPSLADEVRLVTTTLRAGKRTVLSRSVATDDDGEVARSWVTYVRLPRRDDSPTVAEGSRLGRRLVYREDPDLDTERDRPLLDDYLGLRVVPDPEPTSTAGDGVGGVVADRVPVVECAHHPRIHNSFGSLQGGAATVLVERLVVAAAEERFGVPCRVTDLDIQYLGQTRAGPFRVEGEILRRDPGSITCEAQVLDLGQDRAVLDLATAVASPIP